MKTISFLLAALLLGGGAHAQAPLAVAKPVAQALD